MDVEFKRLLRFTSSGFNKNFSFNYIIFGYGCALGLF